MILGYLSSLHSQQSSGHVRAQVVEISGNADRRSKSSDWLAGSLDVLARSFPRHSFASYCHPLAYALSLAVLSFPVFPFRDYLVPLACPILSAPLLLSCLSGWRFFYSLLFFCSWLFFCSCSIFLRVSCICSTRLLIQRACRRPHVECHIVCGRVRPLSDRKVTVPSGLSVCRSVGRSVGRSINQ